MDPFKFKYDDYEITSSQTGLIISILGVALGFFTVKNLPKDAVVAGDRPSETERFQSRLPAIFLLIGVTAFIFFVVLLIL